MNAIGGSALTDENIKVPEGNVERKIMMFSNICTIKKLIS